MGKNIKNLGRELFFGDKKLNNTEKSRYTLHYIILIAFNVIFLFFGIKNLYYATYIPLEGNLNFFCLIMGLCLLIFFVLFTSIILITRFYKLLKLSGDIISVLLLILLLISVALGDNYAPNIIWCLTFPVLTVMLTGLKHGVIYTTILFLLTFLYLFIPQSGSRYGGFIPMNYTFSYILVSVGVITYESILKKNMSFLEKSKKEIETMSKQKTNFFINLAHETKTPLTLISNYFDMFVKKIGNRYNEDVQIIKYNIDKLKRDMINFLDIEKLDRKQIFYNHNQLIGLAKILKNKITLFKALAEKKQIEIITDIKNEIFIKIDPYAIDRILNNLLDNAIRYNNKGGKIFITCKESENHVILEVEDTGIGMTTEQQSNIFNAFYQVSHEKRNIQGIGLGMNIVKKIIDEVGWEIIVKSDPGKGTRIAITLDEYKVVGETPKKVEKYSEPIIFYNNDLLKKEEYIENRYNIFFIEDSMEMLIYLQDVLSRKYNFFYALNGKEALDKLKNIPLPHVIISDIMMDKMDGFLFFDEILKDYKYKAIPFIFLTAKTTKETRIRGMLKGAVDVIYKPFDIEELEAKIFSLINFRQKYKKENINTIINSLYKYIENDSIHKMNNNIEYDYIENNDNKFDITPREIEVINKLGKGLEYKEIAKELGISISTIKTHIQKIYKKCGVQNKIELINALRSY